MKLWAVANPVPNDKSVKANHCLRLSYIKLNEFLRLHQSRKKDVQICDDIQPLILSKACAQGFCCQMYPYDMVVCFFLQLDEEQETRSGRWLQPSYMPILSVVAIKLIEA